MSHHRSWVGPATRGPAPLPGQPLPTVVHDTQGRVLAGLLERVLAGDLATDWVSVERQVVSALEASVQLHGQHQVDDHGRCVICREVRWLWPRRAACTVHAAFASHMPHVATADLRRA